MESTLVIKVKFGDTLRRFNARVDENNQLDLDMAGLRSKILSLFNISPETNFRLRYVDEDGDLVTLADDDDLLDVMRQNLKFLKIDLHVSNDDAGKSISMASGSSTPSRSPRILNPFMGSANAAISDDLKSVLEPVHGFLSYLSQNSASKAESSSPVIGTLVDSICKLGLSASSDSQPQIAVGLGSESNSKASGSPTPISSPHVSNPSVVGGNAAISVQPRPFPEPLNEFISNLMLNLASEAASSSPVIATLNASIAKLSQSMRNSDSQPQTAAGIHSISDACNESVTPAASCTQPSFVASTSEANEQFHENITRGVGACVGAPVASVDLNVLPSDSDSVYAVQVSSAGPEGDSKKGKKATNDSLKCKGGSPGASNSQAAPGNIPTQSPAMGFTPFGECPFSGLHTVDSRVPAFERRRGHPFKRSHCHTEAIGGMFHKGVRCDGCGVYPITGPRYKSKVKENYDLCSICFTEIGNGTDYVKMDRPASGRHPGSVKVLYEYHHPMAHVLRSKALMKQVMSKTRIDSKFILDVTVLDGTIMAPSTAFTKIWRMHNNGTVPWPKGCQLVWIGGDKFSNFHSVNLEIPAEGIPADKELDIAVDFRAPQSPGQYISYWRMTFPTGQKFGQRVWVLIQVDASLTESFHERSQGLNLNIPPEGSDSKGSENIDINVHPVVDDVFLQPCNSNDSPKFGKQQVDEQPRQDLGENLIMDETSLGLGASAPATSVAPPSVYYPSETAPVVTSSNLQLPEGPELGALTPSLGVAGDHSIEETLLKELEEMGFKQVDLNKEILRMNEYNLEQSVEDLCGVSEWDPLLDELQEMGFRDQEMNKRLLKKNNGSIKGVVLDLISGEDV